MDATARFVIVVTLYIVYIVILHTLLCTLLYYTLCYKTGFKISTGYLILVKNCKHVATEYYFTHKLHKFDDFHWIVSKIIVFAG